MTPDGQQLREPTSFAEPAAYLAAIVEASDDAIISKNLDGIITSWNGGAERLFGYTEEEAIGQPITLIIPPDRLQEEAEIIARVKRGERIDHFETVRVARNGHPIDVSISVSPIRDPAGKIIGISKTGRDISKRKQLEKQLQTVSHGLKEPLRGLGIKASMLLEDYGGKLDENGNRWLNDLVNLSKRSNQLVESFLSFSQMGRNLVENVDLNNVVSDITCLMEDRLKEKNAKINVPRPLPYFRGNKKCITEVMRNLVTNAVIYNDKPAPVVEIGYVEEMNTPYGPCRNVFYVKDNGIGIPPEFQGQIFRMFKRLPHAEEYNKTGTGIGLALVKESLDQYNGHIWLESEPGKGSVFYFTVGECIAQSLN